MINAELVYDYTSRRVGAIHRKSDGKLLGTGVFISPQGHMLTCAHLNIGEPSETLVRKVDNAEVDVLDIEVYKDVDILLLRCQQTKEEFEFFTLNGSLAQLNREVFVFGFPDKPYYRQGYFKTTSIASRAYLQYQQVSVQAWGLADRNVFVEGMSGGPVVDLSTRELIGIIYGYDKSLVKSLYTTEEKLFALEAQRLDDFFIPVALIVDRIPNIRNIAMINSNTEHTDLVNRASDVVGLLGFESRLFDLENDGKHSIYSNITIGNFVSFSILIVCVAKDTTLTTSHLKSLLSRIRDYEEQIGAAIEDAAIEKVCIVIENPIDRGTKDLASSSGITIIHADDLVSSLIDFSDYTTSAIEQWEEDRTNISSKYVDLRGRQLIDSEFTPIQSVEKFIKEWIGSSENSRLLVLGRYGSGKTTVCRRLFREIAYRYQRTDSELIPIFVRLNKARASTIKQLIIELLENEVGMRQARFGAFSKLNELGKLLMIFDGFDEMSQHTSQSESFLNMRQLSRYFKGESKVIITCRLEYFIEDKDISNLMSVSEFEVLYKQDDFDAILLEDFSRAQIEEFVNNVFPEEQATEVIDKIAKIEHVEDLAKRPVLLDMLVQTLPDLSDTTKRVSAADLYETYVNRWLDRDLWVGRTTFPKEAKINLMQSMAAEMNRQGSLTIRYEDVLDVVSVFFSNDRNKAAFHIHDILTNSFLSRNERDRHYEFSHKSFFEFFLARHFITEINKFLSSRESGVPLAFGDRRLTYEIFKFMIDMGISEARLWRLIDRTRGRDIDEVKFLGGNAITILKMLGADFRDRDFSDAVLAGALFSDCDLSNSNFQNANLFDNSFVNAILDNVDMTGADVTRADFKSGKIIYSLAYSSALDCVVTDNSANNSVSLWFLDESDVDRKIVLRGHSDHVFCVAFSPDSQLLASAGQDQSIRLWNVKTGLEVGVLRGHLGDIRTLLFRDNDTLLSCGMDGQIMKWDITRMSLSQFASTEGDEYWGMSLAANKNLLATGSLDGKIKLWDYQELSLVNEFLALPHPTNRHIVEFYPDADLILSGSDDGTIFVWNFDDKSWRKVHKQDTAIKSLVVRERGGLVASGAEDGTIVLWEGEDLKYITTIEAHDDYVSSIKFDPTQDRMFSTSPDGTIAVWDTSTYQLISRFEEHFEDFRFSCKGLNLTRIRGMPEARRAHLLRQGAFVGGDT